MKRTNMTEIKREYIRNDNSSSKLILKIEKIETKGNGELNIVLRSTESIDGEAKPISKLIELQRTGPVLVVFEAIQQNLEL